MTRRQRGPRGAPSRTGGDAEWHFLEARRLAELGRTRAAMEQAGFGVRLTLERPEGYLLLGELNLIDGDLVEARKSFEAAMARAKGDLLLHGLEGAVQVAVLEGDVTRSRLLFERALSLDPSDPLNLRPAFVETLLAASDAVAARRELSRCDDDSVDVALLNAITSWRLGRGRDAVAAARRAFLANVFVGPKCAGKDAACRGIAFGVDEATPEHAEALLSRVAALIVGSPGCAEFLAALAVRPEVESERERVVALATALTSEPDERRRRPLKADLATLRDAARIEATSGAIVAAMRNDQPALFGSLAFDV